MTPDGERDLRVSMFAGSSNSLFYDVPMKADFFSGNLDGNRMPKPSLEKVIAWIRGILHPITYANRVYVYDGQQKRYVPESRHIETLAVRSFDYNGYPIPDDRTIKALNRATAETNFPIYPFNCLTDAINVSNGVVRFPVLKLESHHYGNLFDYCIGTPYIDYSSGTPDFDKYANEWGIRDTLINIGGLAIAQSMNKETWKTSFIFEGPPNGGKTTALELIEKTFGCCSHVDLTRLSDDRFALSEVDTNLLNIADETPSMGIRKIEHFKNVTGSVNQMAEEKFKPSKPCVMTAVHVFACNDLPEVRQGDYAFWSRWHIEECKNTFPVDPRKKWQIHSLTVREQYLYLCIRRAQEIIASGYQNNQSPDEVELLWMTRVDGAQRFIQEQCDASGPIDTISLKEIYERYGQWCKQQNPPKPTISDRKLAALLSERDYTKYMSNGATWFRGIIVRKW